MSIPESYIKDIAISINENYRFDNSPVQPYKAKTFLENQLFTVIYRMVNKFAKQRIAEEEHIYHAKKKSYIGRQEIKEKFLHFLNNGSGKGVFLVTGYRGMGKTSFVNSVLNDYAEKYKPRTRWKKLIALFHIIDHVSIINITMAQKQPKDIDVLRLMLIKVYEEATLHSLRNSVRKGFHKVVKFLLVLLILPAFCFFFQEKLGDLFEPYEWINPLLHGVGIFGLVTVSAILFFVMLQMLVSSSRTVDILRPIYDRCYASSSIVKDQEDESIIISFLNRLFSSAERGTRNYAEASAKEIEMALISYLEMTTNEYIFIFDELDKMEPELMDSMIDEDHDRVRVKGDKSFHEQVRERKQAIIHTIASLKNFLTTATARFVFIAGREMFEATLADIADRQSSLGSMFNYVFYVESFLKEKLKSNRGSLSSSIEAYLMFLLYNKTDDEKGVYLLTKDILSARGVPVEVVNKVVILLQNFVIYLTYRSNGSPQKMIKAVHEFIKREDILVNPDDAAEKESVVLVKLNKQSKMYLSFNYNEQYRIGFINYLYRPFLIEYGRSFKKYSDGIVASVPYLFDHLLKFHPFAFSVLHLELIPEVLSVNKVPSVRAHIKNIIDYLTSKHIKETEIGLFEYRFLRRTVNEITMLSKTFETEAAAFNFTLDESYTIKSYIKNKIWLIESQDGNKEKNTELFSVNYLQTVLGDLYFFDQEYFDAVIAYSDATKYLEQRDLKDMNARDFFTLTNTRLKLGLAFERMRSYGEAIAIYTDAIRSVKAFFSARVKAKDSSLILYDLLQLVNQTFLANIMIQEKIGIAGGTICNVYTNLFEFFKLSNQVNSDTGKNWMIQANALLETGNLLYFKNYDRIILKRTGNTVSITEQILEDLHNTLHNNFCREIWTENGAGIDARWSVLSFYLLGIKYIFLGSGVNFELCKGASVVVELMDFLQNPNKKNMVWLNKGVKKNDYKYIGIFLSNIGDVLFASLNVPKDTMKLTDIFNPVETSKYVKMIRDYFKIRLTDTAAEFPDPAFLNSLETSCKESDITNVFKCYFNAGLAFIKRGRKHTASFQFKKILEVLKKTLGEEVEGSRQFVDDVLFLIEHTIVRPVILMEGQNNNHTDEHMKNKFKEFLDLGGYDEQEKDKFLSYCISFHIDIKEMDALFDYLRIKLGQKPLYYPLLVNQYSLMGTQYNRILELDLAVKYNIGMVNRINKVWMRLEGSKWGDWVHEQCVIYYRNYLYSLLAIIKILEIYDSEYVFGFTYAARIHFRIGKFLAEEKDNGKAKREAVVQVGKLPDLSGSYTKGDYMYHFKKAKDGYLKVYQLHGEGVAYVHTMKDMLYLEDDINDNSFHFAMAIERFLNYNNIVKRNIAWCNRYLKKERTVK